MSRTPDGAVRRRAREHRRRSPRSCAASRQRHEEGVDRRVAGCDPPAAAAECSSAPRSPSARSAESRRRARPRPAWPSSACTTGSGVWTVSSATSALSWCGDRCWTKTMARDFASLQARRTCGERLEAAGRRADADDGERAAHPHRRDDGARASPPDPVSSAWRAGAGGRGRAFAARRAGLLRLFRHGRGFGRRVVYRAWAFLRTAGGRRHAIALAEEQLPDVLCLQVVVWLSSAKPSATIVMPASWARVAIRVAARRAARARGRPTTAPVRRRRRARRAGCRRVLMADVAGVADDRPRRSPTARRRTRDT